MRKKENQGKSHRTEDHTQLSDAKMFQLHKEAVEKYEESMRVADLTDLLEEDDAYLPRYTWDKPLGLVMEKPLNAKLV